MLDAVCAAIPGARLERLDGAGHSSYWEMPARFNATLRGFIDGLS